MVQFADTLTTRLPIIMAVVIGAAFLLIVLAFRSPLLALKAAVLNVLSIGASVGVVVAVFQWGWGRSLLGLSENVPIESYVPMMMFAIVFGLSMDYEVFLLSRIKEAWDAGHDNSAAVTAGVVSTARVITAAALIMASVFTAFVASDQVVVKMLAVGMAVSVLIDATVVRLVLVPATMTLLGRACWWLPQWLDRILPHLDVEGSQGEGGDQPVGRAG
jgi:RND superfamily putative drug exporter